MVFPQFFRPSILRPHRLTQHFFSFKQLNQLPHSRRLPHLQTRHYNGLHEQYDPARFRSNKGVLWTIIGLNTAVFAAWQYALPGRGFGPLTQTVDFKLLRTLSENFAVSIPHVEAGKYWTVLTSAFSHQMPAHFIGNMFSLYAFGTVLSAVPGVRPGHIVTLAVGSAVAGSLGHLAHQRNSDKRAAALGASGMVMGLGGAAACLAPSSMMLLFGVVPVRLWILIAGYFVYDSLYLDSVDTHIAHAGHLGGLAFGLAYYLLRLRRFGGIAFRVR